MQAKCRMIISSLYLPNIRTSKKRAIQELRSHYFIDIVIFEWLPPSTPGAIFCYVTKSIILHLVTNTVITENNPTMWKNNPIFGCQEQTY